MGASPSGEERVFLGLGSNLGHREGYLSDGLGDLSRDGFLIVAISPVMESPPLGGLDQPRFLNLVVEGRWDGGPPGLLEAIRRAEDEAGRSRPFFHAPRTLDVDIILFGSRIVRNPDLWVPHPRWKSRSFVVDPLFTLAPELVDPESGLTVREIRTLWASEPVEIRAVGDGHSLFRRPGQRPDKRTMEEKEGR